jgi:cation transport ATPase
MNCPEVPAIVRKNDGDSTHPERFLNHFSRGWRLLVGAIPCAEMIAVRTVIARGLAAGACSIV